MIKSLIPNDTCLLCKHSIEEIGGIRITSTSFRGVFISPKELGGGNADYPHRSVQLDGKNWVVIKGSFSEGFDDCLLEEATRQYIDSKRPWLCQKCAKRVCPECGEPINRPPATDIVYGNGCSSHISVLPVDLGCINPECKKYRDI